MLTAHQTSDRLKSQIDLATANPVPYLKTLAQDSSLRIYARQKAIIMLQFYPSSESEEFLEKIVKEESVHTSLRKFAVKSYIRGFHAKNPGKIQSLLLSYENDARIGLAVRHSLREKSSAAETKKTLKPPKVRNIK